LRGVLLQSIAGKRTDHLPEIATGELRQRESSGLLQESLPVRPPPAPNQERINQVPQRLLVLQTRKVKPASHHKLIFILPSSL